MKLEQLLYRKQMQLIVEEGKERELANLIFPGHRDSLVSAYCALIRLHYEIRRRNQTFPNLKPKVLPPPSAAWCNAAVHILTVADEPTQRYFLASDDSVKNELVAAVLADGGIYNLDEFFVELPPL